MEEDIDTSNLSLNEQVEVLIHDLPGPIQNFVRSPERDAVSFQLTKKYGLHADDAGAFERAYIFMLLGVFTPQEFMQELRDTGLDEETIRSLAVDINEQVFKKLRQQEREPVSPVPAYRTAPPASVPVMSIGESAPSSSSNPTPDPMLAAPIYSNPEIPTVTSQPSSIQSAPAPIYHPHPRTMAEDMALASHGMMGQPATPAQSFQTASVPVTYAQPVSGAAVAPASYAAPTPPPPSSFMTAPSSPIYSRPYTEPVPPLPAPPVMAPIRLTPVDRDHDNAPIRKEFGSDPYREPIEG